MENAQTVSEQMRSDWNQRALEDAHYYVAFGRQQQDEEEFLASGAEVVHAVEWELKRFPAAANRRTWRALEVGCGPGRLMKPLSQYFGEIHGVDVSDEMIRLARERLRAIPHAHVHATDGARLSQFADESFEVVYSYAVFQHIPSREVVRSYMDEIRRVLKPGGVFRGQFNGLPSTGDWLPHDPNRPTTWSGVSFTVEDLRAFTKRSGLRLLALEGVHTQYLWTTWQKPGLAKVAESTTARVRRITNAHSTEPLIPSRGRYAAMSIWVEGLTEDADLNSLNCTVDGHGGTPVYLGPNENGLQQLNVMLSPGVRTGLLPVIIAHEGVVLANAVARIIPPGPVVPRIFSLTDGINLSGGAEITSGTITAYLDEVLAPEQIWVKVNGVPVGDLEVSCADPLPPRYQVNFRLPSNLKSGIATVEIGVGKRALAVREVTVVLPASP